MRDKAVGVLVDDDGVVAVSVVVEQHLFTERGHPSRLCAGGLLSAGSETRAEVPGSFLHAADYPTRLRPLNHHIVVAKGIDGLHIASVDRIHKSPYRDPP
jgi:hypothetical protein